MAPRRLTVARDSDQGPRALTGVPAPLRGRGREFSLAQVLEICLERAGLPLDYDAIMGLSGLAFCPPIATPDTTLGAGREAVETLSLALDPPLQVHEPEPEEALQLVAEAVTAGLPCAALGWGSEKEAWAVICGYDRSRARILGHCLLDEPREQLESWPPELDLLVTMAGQPRFQGSEVLAGALERAANTWEGVAAAWESWIELVHTGLDTSMPEHLTRVQMLADARATAALFLQAGAQHLEPIPAAWLLRAADGFERVVERIENLPEDAQWADHLEAVARIDEAAFTNLRLALTAEFEPEAEELP